LDNSFLGESTNKPTFPYVANNPVNRIDPLGLKDCDCPGGEWSSFSTLAASAFWGRGGTIARTTYKCKTNNKVCKATSICFGGGAIGAVGIGIDFGGYSKSTVGVENVYKQRTWGSLLLLFLLPSLLDKLLDTSMILILKDEIRLESISMV
jgi:hypothetical protein